MKRIGHQLILEEAAEVYTLSISPELQDEAGDISYAHLAPLGNIEAGDTLLNVEASKAAIEVPAPFGGKIIARNEEAEDRPDLLDSTQAEDRWLVRMMGVDPKAFEAYPEVK